MSAEYGMDCWLMNGGLIHLLQSAQQNGIELYEVKEKNGLLYFSTPVFHRAVVRKVFPQADLRYTSGIIGFFLRNLCRPSRLLSLFVFLCVWGLLSRFVFVVQIFGDTSQNKLKVNELLQASYGERPYFDIDAAEIEKLLQERMSSQLKWVEADKKGSLLSIRFTSRRNVAEEKLERNDLYAQRDGVIAGFDVQHGNKCVQINDVVKKGDLLVSSEMMDSLNKKKYLYVKGRVFAYTWETIEVSCAKQNLPQPVCFFQLLLNARTHVSKDFLKDDRIEKENILQFEEKAGKITMRIHYTIYRDISSPV